MRKYNTPLMRFLKQTFCRHQWDTNLVFSGGRNTHREIKSCHKCDKSVTVFSGTRQEWYDYHGFGEAKN